MDIRIEPKLLHGGITPPPSKSVSHRLIICAALARGESLVSNLAFSRDILATLSCMEGLGAAWEAVGTDAVRIRGLGGRPYAGPLPRFDCGESGSTLRFLIPIALAVAGGGVFTGGGRLMERPQKPYFDLFDQSGILHELRDGVLTVRGTLPAGTYTLPGDVSSQFISGLLFALPLLDGDSRICLSSPLEGDGYVHLTTAAQETFGVHSALMAAELPQYAVPGGQSYAPRDARVEADWSQAGFWYAALALGSKLDIMDMNPQSVQGDKCIVPCFNALTRPGSVELDVSQCPDLVPPLAVMAALREGKTRIVNAARLRIKESDRLASVTQTLNAMGAQIEEFPDSLAISGVPALLGGVELDCCNDHRIAMMAAIAATRCAKPVVLRGADCVNKSYPRFWDDYRRWGGAADVL